MHWLLTAALQHPRLGQLAGHPAEPTGRVWPGEGLPLPGSPRASSIPAAAAGTGVAPTAMKEMAMASVAAKAPTSKIRMVVRGSGRLGDGRVAVG